MTKKITLFLSLFLLIHSQLFSQAAAPTPTPDPAKESEEDKKHNDSAGRLSKEKDGNVMFTADWRNAELKDFLKGMSAIVKKNILVDDSVKGRKITIISQKKVNVKDAYSFMKSVLESQGFGLVEENDIIKVVRTKDALAKSGIVRIGREPISEEELKSNKIITQVVPIYQANAGELEPLLKRVTSPDTDIIVYRLTNTLVLSGSSSDISKLLKLIERLDQRNDGPGAIASAGDIHIYTLEYNEAEKLAAVLTKLDNPVVEMKVVDPAKPATTYKG
jgi:general secretion pathway protein D